MSGFCPPRSFTGLKVHTFWFWRLLAARSPTWAVSERIFYMGAEGTAKLSRAPHNMLPLRSSVPVDGQDSFPGDNLYPGASV